MQQDTGLDPNSGTTMTNNSSIDQTYIVCGYGDEEGTLSTLRSIDPFLSEEIPSINQQLNTELNGKKRLILVYDSPKFPHIKKQIENLSGDIVEFHNLSSSLTGYDYLNICIECTDDFESHLEVLNNYIASHSEFLAQFEQVSYHITFDKSHKFVKQQQYTTFIENLTQIKEKVIQVSIIDKYPVETVYLTDKEDLTRLGEEIQQDINNWPNLKILDYGDNCIRFFPGVKFPDTLEVMNIGGGYSLETLGGFTMPSHLTTLIANNNCITSIDNVKFPSTLRTLDLSDNRLYFLNYVEWPENLEYLNLSNNRIDNIRNVEFPNNLKSLNIGQNPIDSLKGCKFPDHLHFLDISFIPNESMTGIKFPDYLVSLNLQESMTNTRGLKLPNSLKYVNLSGNGVNSINPLKLPNSIQILNLSNNNIKTLNKVIFPTNLKSLLIGNNLITTLKNVTFPETLTHLNLEMDPDSMDDKRISNLKDIVLPQGLEILQLGYQSIKTMEGIDLPKNLKMLDLSYNDLKLMRSVNWPNLTILDISGNPELIEIDQVLIPKGLKLLKLAPQLIPNLPGTIIEKANNKQLKISKSEDF